MPVKGVCSCVFMTRFDRRWVRSRLQGSAKKAIVEKRATADSNLALSLIAAVYRAQEPPWGAALGLTTGTSRVPNVVSYSGVVTDLDGTPMAGVADVSFLLYKDAQGGAPLWMQTQNVHLD